jgi:C4-dicarboxylate-specific signal transduction histidine kinase
MDRRTARECLYRRFVAEEVASGLRHTLVNKLAGLGALTHHLKRQLATGETPPPQASVLRMLDEEIAAATVALDLRLLAPVVARPAAVPLAAALAETLRTAGLRPPGVEVVGPPHDPAAALVDPDELDLAVCCLVENACEALAGPGGLVCVRCAAVPGDDEHPLVAVEVADDGPGLDADGRRRACEPFHSSKPGRLGLGLNVAARAAQRGHGRLELHPAAGGSGLVARLLLPRRVE